LVDPGDTVIVGKALASWARCARFQEAGANIETVTVREDGMDIDALEAMLIDLKSRGIHPKFIYTTPTFQNPTGTLMPLANRKRLACLPPSTAS
jgi:2-aminoadipate transaminase